MPRSSSLILQAVAAVGTAFDSMTPDLSVGTVGVLVTPGWAGLRLALNLPAEQVVVFLSFKAN
jgi:hypothetical protein